MNGWRAIGDFVRGLVFVETEAEAAWLRERSGPTCAFCRYRTSGQCCFPAPDVTGPRGEVGRDRGRTVGAVRS